MTQPVADPVVPVACPDCLSDQIKGPDQPGTGLSHWRCLKCGVVCEPRAPARSDAVAARRPRAPAQQAAATTGTTSRATLCFARMKITDLRATTVAVPLQAPLRHANGCHWGRFVRTIVEVETDTGLVGLGEMGGGGESAVAGIRALKSYPVGRDPARLEEMRFLLANPTASLYNNRRRCWPRSNLRCLDLLGQAWACLCARSSAAACAIVRRSRPICSSATPDQWSGHRSDERAAQSHTPARQKRTTGSRPTR